MNDFRKLHWSLRRMLYNETMRIFCDNVRGYMFVCDIGHVILLNMRLQVGGVWVPCRGKLSFHQEKISGKLQGKLRKAWGEYRYEAWGNRPKFKFLGNRSKPMEGMRGNIGNPIVWGNLAQVSRKSCCHPCIDLARVVLSEVTLGGNLTQSFSFCISGRLLTFKFQQK